MTIINTNTGAIQAQAVMQRANTETATAMSRLSSGLRINAAKDDAAGMAIAEKMTSQVMGLNQAVRNATDGKNLIDTTEGAHTEVSNMLQRMRELAVQSSNDTNTASDRGKIASEAKALIAEINRVSETTTYNGMKVLDGSFSGKQFQIGADGGQTINVNVDSASARVLGANKVEGSVQVITDGSGTAAQNLTISGSKGQETLALAAEVSAKDAAAAINGVSGSTGVTATAVTKAELSGLSEAGTVNFTVNGKDIGNVMISDPDDMTALRDAINNASGTTGVTAELGDTKGKVVLTSATGENIAIEGFSHTPTGAASDATMTVTGMDSSGVATTVTGTLDEAGDVEAVITGTVDFASDKTFTVTNDAAGFTGAAAGSKNSDLSSVADIDLSTTEGAAKAIEVLDMAIEKVSSARSDLGAISNRLDSTISNLTNISANTQAAKSNITDADFAQESTNLARGQILSQAATAMLAQANSSKQGVLSLLRG